MKIDKRNWRHWLYLITSGAYAFITLIFRPFRPRRNPVVILYGHKLNGNLKAFADYYADRNKKDFRLYFATLDPDYYEQLKKEKSPVPILKLTNFKDMIKISSSSAIITDHGTHTLSILLKLTNIKFIDVWHGIGFKAEKAESFEPFNRYAEHWVTSKVFADMWVNMFKRDRAKVKVTGYAREDPLLNGVYDRATMRKKYGIEAKFKKIIIIAPTWQNVKTSSVVPFGVPPAEFFAELDKLAGKHKSLVIFRAHLNTVDNFSAGKFKNVRVMSHRDYPLAEEFLSMADVLVSDWSSIVFDYLVLHRPTIFLETPREEFSLDPKYRFGEVVKDFPELLLTIEKYVLHPELFMKEHSGQVAESEKMAFGVSLDGKSSERYYQRLMKLIGKS